MQVAVKKILTISLEIEVLERKTHFPRIKAAHEAAVNAAVDAVRAELLDGSMGDVSSRMTWDYRWADSSTAYAGGEEDDGWEEESSTA
jgi:hypothetical protein